MDRARTVKKRSPANNSGEGKPSLYIFRNFISTFLIGFFMGIANLVPGVSGGTVAFMTGIFEKLVSSLANLSFKNVLKLFTKKGFAKGFKENGYDFLLILVSGAVLSIIVLSKPMSFLLEKFPVLTLLFFSGLILGSLPIIYSNIGKKSRLSYSFVGFLFVFTVNLIEKNYHNAASFNDSLLFLFLSGALAMCAMILPGVSGAFVLVLLGQYEKVINAVNVIDIKILLLFGSGAILGIVLFAKFLKFIFSRHRDSILGFFFGTMIAAAIFLPDNKLKTFIASYRNILPFLSGFVVALLFSIYEIRAKRR
ncbi:MAG: putative rane protein [Thermotogaceae bacterium]|jgi:putative membrane protein|nr:putative rane protein [Thermotogaceae bacterium]MDN5338790.1 putative rane protein [Thermotogaceae bacterium]